MARLNRFECIGNLGADPELRYTPSGKAVAEVRIAVNNGQKQPDGTWTDDTIWIRASVWNEAAERAAEQLRKGNMVYAEGQLEIRDWQDRDGRDRYSVELKFARVISLERKPREDAPPADDPAPVADARPRGAPPREPVGAAAGARDPGPTVDVDDIKFD